MPRSTGTLDRAVAALASKVTPLVGDQLAPLLMVELEKLKEAIQEDVADRVAAEIGQVQESLEGTVQSALRGLVEEVHARQIQHIDMRIARDVKALVEVVRQQKSAGLTRDHHDISWFHSVDLGDGVTTDGFKSAIMLENEFNRLRLSPADLAGKRVLDIGCNDGFFSLKCARAGADVTAVDGIFTDGMKYLQRHVTPKLRFYSIDIMSSSFAELGQFDVILYLGVLYHSMYPFEQLVRIANACAKNAILFIETEYYNLPSCEDEPTIYYDYNQKLSIDASSPTYPSVAWLTQTLARLGFGPVSVLDPALPLHLAARGRITLRADYTGGTDLRRPFLFAAQQV